MGPPAAQPTHAVAISATFTAEPLQEALAFWLSELGLNYAIRFAQYNQVFQTLLDPVGLFRANRDGFNVVLFRLQDWTRADQTESENRTAIESNTRELASAVQSLASSGAHVIVLLCPSPPGFYSSDAHAALAQHTEEILYSGLHTLSTVRFAGPSDLSRLYPVVDYYDGAADELGHIPYTPDFFAALATMIARQVHLLEAMPYKVIALDCDNTLWRGICGEDGPEGVVVDAGARALQEFMLAQREAGTLLCICSRNNEEDVVETFRVHADMPLRWEDFSARRINWEPKSRNLISVADELGLGLDSFIFLDDSAMECAEVQADCPEVLAIALPEDPGETAEYLRHVWAFDHRAATEEDRKRAAMYAQRIERERWQRQAAGIEEFIAGLQLRVAVEPLALENLPRAAQLTQRTNQMNFTMVRRTEAEIKSLLDSGGAECLAVRAGDRFGDYGLVGLLIFRTRARALELDTFLLSCRALGRGVEHRMLARLGEIAGARALPTVEVPFIPGARNRPALAFLESVAAAYRHGTDGRLVFHVPAGHARAITYKPGDAPVPPSAEPEKHAEAKPVTRKFTGYVHIARELSNPGRLLRELASRRARQAPEPEPVSDPPRTRLEHRIAAIWCDLLGLPAIGVHTGFFDAGGHSLLAVQLLLRLRDAFGVELSLDVVYSGELTVAELARAVELAQLGALDSSEYASLLAELEQMSDEEARALLEAEDEKH